ncbi:hypothetical protein OROHE_015052 [Orobanche hederae]
MTMDTSFQDGSITWRAEDAVADNSEALQDLRKLIIWPLYPTESKMLGLKWPGDYLPQVCILLLYGLHGIGKIGLVRAVVRQCDAHLTAISPHTIHSSHAGESEGLREAYHSSSA